MITLYRLKEHIAEGYDDYGIYFYFENGKPVPDNYLRVWQGDLGTNDFKAIYAEFGLNPPRELGCGISDTDILEVDGMCYILTPGKNNGFTEIEFDTESVKTAIHVRCGDGIELDKSAPFSKKLAYSVCEMDIPIGYESQSGVFHPDFFYQHDTFYLNPDYAKGDVAKRLVSRLGELIEHRNETMGELLNCRPVHPADIDRVWQQFAERRAELNEALRQEQAAIAEVLSNLTNDDCTAIATFLYSNGLTAENLADCLTQNNNQSQQM